MDWIEAVVYGVVQGATEYLPVSSSAHLALIPWLFGWSAPSFAFDILVQLGTLGAVCVYLRADLKAIGLAMWRGLLRRQPFADADAKKGWFLLLSTIPAVVVGLVWKNEVEHAFGNTRQVLIELFATGALLFGAELLMRNSNANRPVTWWRAVLIGVGQALAILPGISRSGATIAAALALGVDRKEAGRFSFLMSIPVMLGAAVLGIDDLFRDKELLVREGPALALAFVIAALVGFLCIKWFLGFVTRHSLVPFAIYCWVVSVAGLLAHHLTRS